MDTRRRKRGTMDAADDDENHNEEEEERTAAVSAAAAAGTSQPSATKKKKASQKSRTGSGGGRISESSTLAFDYFNNPSLFGINKSVKDCDNYLYTSFTGVTNKQRFQNMTIGEFFALVHETMEKEDLSYPSDVFESYYLYGKALSKASADYRIWEEEIAENMQLTSVDFGITTHALAHNYDLKLFEEQINHVFNWYKVDYRARSSKDASHKKVGPYLCFVQSTGMGKTKLMYEYRMKSFQEDSQVASCLILPVDIRYPSHETDVFDFRPDFRNDLRYCTRIGEATRIIYSKLDKILKETLEKNLIRRKANWTKNHGNESAPALTTLDDIEECDKIVLMFDESQLLVEEQYKFDAFLFRCVRVWLREKRKVKKVVAVFAGTDSSKITDFREYGDNYLQPETASSRGPRDDRKYHDNGGTNQLYPIFYHTTTMGSCLPSLTGETEYERSIYYGRPLFAIMATKGILEEKIPNVLCRMLLVNDEETDWEEESTSDEEADWEEELTSDEEADSDLTMNAVVNILGTRVPLGKASVEIVSNLVSNAFANISASPGQFATLPLTYLPDPFCARLAMCMMDQDFRHRPIRGWKTTIEGKRKVWWTMKLKEIFSTEMVRPVNDDYGEVVVAFYMLFCGDLLRKRISDHPKNKDQGDYSQFSVSLDAWLGLLLSGGKAPEEAMSVDAKLEALPLVSVGFIQVCRNYMRSYSNSWERLNDESFLKHIFESGVAFYSFQGCDLIDMVVPLRVNTEDTADCNASPNFKFVPMLVSIQCQGSFDQQQAETTCDAMTKRAKKSNMKHTLCLLIVFGSESAVPFEGEIGIDPLSPKVSQLLLKEDGVVGKAIRVPRDDAFGLTAAFPEMTPDSAVRSNLFSFHSFLMAHGDIKDETLTAENTLSGSALRTAWKEEYTDLRKAMISSGTRGQGKQDEESLSKQG